MLISNKCKQATIAMVNLARLSKDTNAVSLVDLAKRQNLSLSYLEPMFSKLKKSGLVESVRGPGGGYRIRNFDVSVAEIVSSIKGDPQSDNEDWNEISNKIDSGLKEITLFDLTR